MWRFWDFGILGCENYGNKKNPCCGVAGIFIVVVLIYRANSEDLAKLV